MVRLPDRPDVQLSVSWRYQFAQCHIKIVAIILGIAQAYRIPVFPRCQPEIQFLLLRVLFGYACNVPGRDGFIVNHDSFLADNLHAPHADLACAGNQQIDFAAAGKTTTAAAAHAGKLPDDADAILLYPDTGPGFPVVRKMDGVVAGIKMRVRFRFSKTFFLIQIRHDAGLLDTSGAIESQYSKKQYTGIAIDAVILSIFLPSDCAMAMQGLIVLYYFLHSVFEFGRRWKIDDIVILGHRIFCRQ